MLSTDAVMTSLERRMTATLTPAEREHLRSALIKIIAQLTAGSGSAQPPAESLAPETQTLPGPVPPPEARV